MKQKLIYTSVVFLLGLLLILFTGRGCNSSKQMVEQLVKTDTLRISDTLVIFDTLRIIQPKPYYVEVVRTDTLIHKDTLKIPIPIEQKTYQTDDYKAVIEGYKPSLIRMDLYKKETFIRDTITIKNSIVRTKSARWAVSIGAGIGYGTKGIEPYIGINAGYVIWSK